MIPGYRFDWSLDGAQFAIGQVLTFLAAHSNAIVFAAGLIITAALIRAIRELNKRPGSKAKRVATFSAVTTMVWTSEGLLTTAIRDWHVPWQVAAIGFCVFEAMLLASWLTAEDNRREYGHPGPAGRYAFLIASVQGIVAASGAGTLGEAIMRVGLPPLAVGMAWVLLTQPRPGDKPEWKAERAKRAADREATWVWTPNTILVRWGIRHPGTVTVTEAQRTHRLNRMVELVDVIETATGRRADKVRATARTRLRRLVRSCDLTDIAEVARRAGLAANFETLLLPSKTGGRTGGDTARLLAGEPPMGEWTRQVTGPRPPAGARPARDADAAGIIPTSPAPAGVPVVEEVDAEWFTRHSDRIALVQRVTGDGWWNGSKPLSVDAMQVIGKEHGEGLSNRTNAKETAACLRRLRAQHLVGMAAGTVAGQNPEGD